LKAVAELARQDERVVFLGSDITKRDVASMAADYPDRYFAEGIYESHLIGMSAGLALSGKIPYINTIATFLTRRCYEQLLLDLGLHNVPVRLIGSGGGVVYAPLGATHLAVDDFAILRVIPNMTIVAVCDAEEMKRLMPQTLKWPHPMYIRLAKGGDRVVSSPDQPFVIGEAIPLKEGSDVLFISTGVATQVALEAAADLLKERVNAGVLHVHTLKPLDSETILTTASKAAAVVTIEEHRAVGGLGSAVAELIAEAGIAPPKGFRRLGFPDVFTEEHGSQALIMEKYGLSANNAAAVARKLLRS
jgi:transketolase